jgi:membrane protein DedA with SNARE-associated domain/diacylglycerol kinase family enzyme
MAQTIAGLSEWTYLVVGVFAFFETAAFVGLVVPGETAVLAGGVVAHSGGVELVPLILVVWLAASMGDTTSFMIGRRVGRPFLESHGPRLRLDASRLARIDRFYARHGATAVVTGRFVGVARAVMPFLAGTSAMALRRFVACSLVGALVWSAMLTLGGYAFSDSIAAAGDAVTRIALGAVLILAALLIVRRQIRSRRAGRSRSGAQPDALIDAPVIERAHDASARRAPASGMTTSPARVRARATDRAPAVLVVINGRASGTTRRPRLLDEVTAGLREQGLCVDARVTHGEGELCSLLAAAEGRRVVLVGGDGSVHAAANVALETLPEIALIPAGRANNIARALGIPTDVRQALTLAARAPAQPVDVLHVRTPQRALYAVEALSAGFHADARSRYMSDNSGDTRQGVQLLAGAIARYAPYRVDVRLDDREIDVCVAAQLFLSNLPYFGFGFQVDPGADPADGLFEAVLIEAGSRHELLAQLMATHGGRHIGRRGVQRIVVHHAELTRALPLVADTVSLGTTTATIRIDPSRLRIASRPAVRAA